MPPIDNLVAKLASTLERVPNDSAVRVAALHELLHTLAVPRGVYRLLSSRLTVLEILYIVSSLAKIGLVAQVDGAGGGRFAITDPGNSFPVTPSLGLHLVDCNSVQTRDGFREILVDLLADKKSAYNQSVETHETLIRRLKMMQAFGDLNHSSLLLLGDDALFSVFLAVHGYDRSIVVADIDADLLMVIERLAKRHGFKNIEVVQHDMLQPMPERLRGKFECFAVNGFKDVGGLMMFVCRALESLVEPTSLRVGYLNYGNHEVLSSTQSADEYRIHSLLNKFGLFVDYAGPCPETHVNEQFCASFALRVSELATIGDDELRLQACVAALARMKQEFGDLSWVAMESFPNIQLSPLKMARCRIHHLNWPEIRKFARLGQMYAGRRQTA